MQNQRMQSPQKGKKKKKNELQKMFGFYKSMLKKDSNKKRSPVIFSLKSGLYHTSLIQANLFHNSGLIFAKLVNKIQKVIKVGNPSLLNAAGSSEKPQKTKAKQLKTQLGHFTDQILRTFRNGTIPFCYFQQFLRIKVIAIPHGDNQGLQPQYAKIIGPINLDPSVNEQALQMLAEGTGRFKITVQENNFDLKCKKDLQMEVNHTSVSLKTPEEEILTVEILRNYPKIIAIRKSENHFQLHLDSKRHITLLAKDNVKRDILIHLLKLFLQCKVIIDQQKQEKIQSDLKERKKKVFKTYLFLEKIMRIWKQQELIRTQLDEKQGVIDQKKREFLELDQQQRKRNTQLLEIRSKHHAELVKIQTNNKTHFKLNKFLLQEQLLLENQLVQLSKRIKKYERIIASGKVDFTHKEFRKLERMQLVQQMEILELKNEAVESEIEYKRIQKDIKKQNSKLIHVRRKVQGLQQEVTRHCKSIQHSKQTEEEKVQQARIQSRNAKEIKYMRTRIQNLTNISESQCCKYNVYNYRFRKVIEQQQIKKMEKKTMFQFLSQKEEEDNPLKELATSLTLVHSDIEMQIKRVKRINKVTYQEQQKLCDILEKQRKIKIFFQKTDST